MSTALPVISVIVPTRNNIRTIEACLASVRAQTHEAVELVVVDNHSDDGTPEIARRFADTVLTAADRDDLETGRRHERAGEGCRGGGTRVGRALRRPPLEQRPQLEDLVDVGAGELRDEGAPARPHLDQPLVGQPLQGRTHRRATHAERLRQHGVTLEVTKLG